MCWDAGRGNVGDPGVEFSWIGEDWANCSKRPTRLETRFFGVSIRAIMDILGLTGLMRQ